LDVLPFRDNTFSAVYMVSALQYLEHPEIGLNEARRVLADDGSFVSLDYNPQCYASALGLIQKKQEYDTQLDQCLYEKMSKQNLGKWMSGSGFSDIKIRNLLFLPGNLPLPVVVYRIINGILEWIPFIKRFSIMLASHSRKRGCGN
jgi:SAM-dependent methyltransferase